MISDALVDRLQLWGFEGDIAIFSDGSLTFLSGYASLMSHVRVGPTALARNPEYSARVTNDRASNPRLFAYSSEEATADLYSRVSESIKRIQSW